ncbi:hypothetical protein ACX3UK_08415 [Lactobacillus gasseri]
MKAPMNVGFLGILLLGLSAYLFFEIKKRAKAEMILKNSFKNPTKVIDKLNKKIEFLTLSISDLEDSEKDFLSDSFSDKRKRRQIQRETKALEKSLTEVNEVKDDYFKLQDLYKNTHGQMNTQEARVQLLKWVKNKNDIYIS